MDPQFFEQALTIAEQHLQTLANDLVAGDAAGVQLAAEKLQKTLLALRQHLPARAPLASADGALLQRVHALGEGLNLVRSNLARRACYVQRALGVLIAPPAHSTYGDGSATGAASYSALAPRTGAFRVLSA